MNITGKISVRPYADLIGEEDEMGSVSALNILSAYKKINKPSNTPKKNAKKGKVSPIKVENQNRTIGKKVIALKKDLTGQTKIDNYFKSALKNFKIEQKNDTETGKKASPRRRENKRLATGKKSQKNRKRLPANDENKTTIRKKLNLDAEGVIDLCLSDCEDEKHRPPSIVNKTETHPFKSKTSLPSHSAENVENVENIEVKQKINKKQTAAVPEIEPSSPNKQFNDTDILWKPLSQTSSMASKRAIKRQISSKSNPLGSKSCDNQYDKRKIARLQNKAIKSISAPDGIKQKKSPDETTICVIPKEIINSSGHILKETGNSSCEVNVSNSLRNNANIVRSEKIIEKSETTDATNFKRITRSSSNTLTMVSVNTLNNINMPSGETNINSATTNSTPITSKYDTTDALVQSSSGTSLQDIINISDNEGDNIEGRGKRKTTKSQKTNKFKEATVQKTKKTKTRICPPYKIVEGTTFAVDAFQYGSIQGVTHYFLTHYHADHYAGLSGKFTNDIFMSSITARLVRVFIPLKEQYIHELELNKAIVINGVEVTAINANHCPGAIMLIFKTKDGECILHTGDFRANPQMESEPIFWNNDIHTIYLDTTYISKKYAFCDQSESIDRAINLIQEFREKNVGTRVLYVCGSYLIGKEKFWSALANEFSWKIFTEGRRKQALLAVNDKKCKSLLADNPLEAQLHIISMQQIGYHALLEYLNKYSEHFDVIFAIRPSGWEMGNKTQYRGKVNIAGIEYSEHSSYEEMKRFVRYLRPLKVISTVPLGSNSAATPKIPRDWYKNDKRQFQPSITSFFKLKPDSFTSIQLDEKKEKFSKFYVSPLQNIESEVICNSKNNCAAQESFTKTKKNGFPKESFLKFNTHQLLFNEDDDFLP